MKTNQCPAKDDNDIECQNIMTQEEKSQDNLCTRCANLLWEWTQNMDMPFIFEETKK